MRDGRVYIVDDDDSVRRALLRLFESLRMKVHTFASGSEFFDFKRPDDAPACLILDVRMPGESGLEMQRRLASIGDEVPVVFLSGHADVPMSVRAMKDGAIEFLTKPFREQDLLDAVNRGLALSAERKKSGEGKRALELRHAALSKGEQDVMRRAIHGSTNRQIADELGVSEITVKVRRAAAMRKMKAGTFAELVRMGLVIGIG